MFICLFLLSSSPSVRERERNDTKYGNSYPREVVHAPVDGVFAGMVCFP